MITAEITDTFTTKISSEHHHLIADEPIALGGNNKGMNPQELLESSLASCTTITLKMYLNRKDWKVSKITISVDSKKEKNLSEVELTKRITVEGSLDEKQLDRLHYIAGRCPIHKILEKSVSIHSEIELL